MTQAKATRGRLRRAEAGPGGGRWARAVDLHEELETIGHEKEEDLDGKYNPERRAVQREARLARQRMLALIKTCFATSNGNSGLLVMFGDVLRNMLKIELKLERKKGKKKSGTVYNQVIKGMYLRRPAATLLPLWNVQLIVFRLELPDDEWAAACEARTNGYTPRYYNQPQSST